MTDKFNTRLLAAILKTQTEADAEGTLSADRVRAALSGGEALTEQERLLIWRSPDARDLYLAIRREVRADMKERVQNSGLGFAEQRLAASGGDFEEIEGRGFVVSLFCRNGTDWTVLVRLSDEYRALISPATSVSLRDSGGLEWASGVPDSIGSFGADWAHPGETPRSRLQNYGLRLDP